MSDFQLLSIFVNDNFDDFLELDKENIDFRHSLDVSPSILPKILQRGASITAVCIFKGAEKCLSWILSNTDITNLYDEDDRSLFDFAAASSNPNIYSILENNCSDENQDHPDSNGMLPIHYAAMFGNLQVLQYLWMNGSDLNTAANGSLTPLDLAVMYWQPEVVSFLLANLELNDENYHSIFKLASRPMNPTALYGNTVQKAEKILNLFIDSGLDYLTITNFEGKNLLFFFLEKQDMNLFKILLQKDGADEIKNENGLTPYEFARRYKDKNITDLILEYSKK